MICMSLSSCWLSPGVDEPSGPHVIDNPNRGACGCSNLVSLARILQGEKDLSQIEQPEIESDYAELISRASPEPAASFAPRAA